MNKIHLLSEDLINKIAAGEVVERPASVVKELVENSIDAGATKIIIEIQGAGKKLVRVADNGNGMTEDEIELALQRHSTSKISSLDDLFNIRSLGFRGEALPSIASVSKLKIERNPSGAGLTIEAKELFYNVPARRKFLKSDVTEMGHIGDIISKYILASPQITFKLFSDGKPLISSSGSGKLIEAIMSVYGNELAKDLIEINFDFAAGKISGFISRPTLTRIDKNYETFFVNQRYVKNFLLNRALEEAYRTLIPGNRYPVGIIFIEIDPKQVDVNVHPSKREVKFLKTNEVMEGVREAAREGLKKALGGMSNYGKSDFGSSTLHGGQNWQPEMMEPFFSINNEQLTMNNNEINISSAQPLSPLYQLKLTYIVATDGEELVLIDQHAAHERIIYDQLSQELGVRSQEMKSQTLLMPETIEVEAKEAITLKENLAYLNELGFELEEFGGSALLLRAVPAVAVKAAPKQLLIDIVSEMQELGRGIQQEVKRENIRKLVACHSAIKAGDKLTQEEMNRLIRDLYATPNPLTCPHGRPTIVRVTETELAKRFGR